MAVRKPKRKAPRMIFVVDVADSQDKVFFQKHFATPNAAAYYTMIYMQNDGSDRTWTLHKPPEPIHKGEYYFDPTVATFIADNGDKLRIIPTELYR